VVGDLHGYIDKLKELTAMVNFDTEVDRLFSVGDMCDRGPDSFRCWKLIRKQWFYAIIGNHEIYAIAHKNADHDMGKSFIGAQWDRFGGMWRHKYEDKPEFNEMVDELEQLPSVIVVKGNKERKPFNIIHAEFFGEQDELEKGEYRPYVFDGLMYGRERINRKIEKDNKIHTTYCGHSIVKQVGSLGPQVYLDTGCYSTGKLSMINTQTMKVYTTDGDSDTKKQKGKLVLPLERTVK